MPQQITASRHGASNAKPDSRRSAEDGALTPHSNIQQIEQKEKNARERQRERQSERERERESETEREGKREGRKRYKRRCTAKCLRFKNMSDLSQTKKKIEIGRARKGYRVCGRYREWRKLLRRLCQLESND